MMLAISPLLTVIYIASLSISIFFMRPLLKKSQKRFAEQQRTLGELNGHVEETYTGHQIVKAFGREKKAIERFDEVNQKLYDAGRAAQFISGIVMPLMFFVETSGTS